MNLADEFKKALMPKKQDPQTEFVFLVSMGIFICSLVLIVSEFIYLIYARA